MSGRVPLVSVCVPSHNYVEFLGRCLDSVLAQSFREFELLVVDDASTDDSVRVAESYDDPRVRIVRHSRNVGAVETWNHALALARGEYAGFLCADDYFLPDKLSRQVEVIAAHPDVALVHADGEWVSQDGVPEASFRSAFPPELQAHQESDHVVLAPLELPRLAAGYNYIHLSSALFRRRAVANLGSFSPAFPYAADWDLWLRLAARHGIAYVAQPLSAIRRHSRNLTLSMQASGRAFRDWYGVMERTFQSWPADAGPVAPVRAEAWAVIRQHLLAQVHANYARGGTQAVRRDLQLAFQHDPRLRLDGLTLATYLKAWLGVPRLKRWLPLGNGRHA